MTNDELIDYIKSQLNKNIPESLIRSRLSDAGWHHSDIDEGIYEVIKIPILSPKIRSTEESSVPKSSIIDNLPKSAIISSYSDDVKDASKIKDEVIALKSKKPIKLIIGAIVIIIILGVNTAIGFGLIKIPGLSFSFIKKDPKIVLSNAAAVFGNIKSYKIETNATLSMPLISNITIGLSSGEVVPSNDRDFISMNTKGSINQNNTPTTSFDYATTITSSLLKNSITTSFKYDDILFVNVPDLSQIFKENIPQEGIVSIKKGEFNLAIPLLPSIIADKIKIFNIDKILSDGIPPYINNQIAELFKEFINNADIIEKDPENIRSIPTYRYLINADKASTKKFLSAIVDMFVASSEEGDKTYLDDIVAVTTIDSLEVWIGKDDNNIYQYSISFAVPLSKVVGLDDKGIAGDVVKLDWQTTYYDFNVPNNITIPVISIPIGEFMRNIFNNKIKNIISLLKENSVSLRNAGGSFGKSANVSGSCTNPTPGSLYSPTGHRKGADTAVGSIASTMNTILSYTNGLGYCYSKADAWAAAFPLSGGTDSFYCVDSTGASKILDLPINGVVCK